jgi:hypothetical protein
MKLPSPTDAVSIIPDLYYDFIARVVPGTVFLVATCFVCEPSRSLLLKRAAALTGVGLTTTAFLLLLGTGYIVGLLATPFSESIRQLYLRRSWKKALAGSSGTEATIVELFGYSPNAKPVVLEFCYRRMHDYIRTKDTSSRSRVLSKMQAESSLASNLSTCFSILFFVKVAVAFVGSWSLWSYLQWHSTELVTIIVVLLASFNGAFDRNVRLLQRHFAFLQRLQQPAS